MIPTKVKKSSATEISIHWDDGHQGRHLLQTLRKNCPCASCNAEREKGEITALLPVLKPGQYDLRAIQPVGNYALQVSWGDGHATGFYTFDYLREICECEQCGHMSAE